MVMCEKIRKARIQAGLSQAELASAAGIPVGDVHCYEDGTMVPEIQNQVTLSRILGISFYYLRHSSCDDPLEHICIQDAMVAFYDMFGADALQRYEDAVNEEIEKAEFHLCH
jgi:transcriptional regulator with XRE-family HTH domain